MAELFLVFTIICVIASVIMFIGLIANIVDTFFDNRFTNRFSDIMDALGEFAIVGTLTLTGFAGIVSVVHHMFF